MHACRKDTYDPLLCTVDTKCRVVFALSGGGPCADNYAEVGDLLLKRMVELDPPEGRSHLAVVTVDPTCWAWLFEPYPDEITQILAVKADLVSHNFLDVSGDFYATGCSHGAIQMVQWAVETDPVLAPYPKRTFVRSAGGMTGAHPDCEYHEQWCGVKQKAFDDAHFRQGIGDVQGCNNFPDPWQHSHTDLERQCQDDYIAALTKFTDKIDDVVTTREIGRSWGVNDDDDPGEQPVCDTDFSPSKILCAEEGGFAATDGGRQFRARWRDLEDAQNRSGYFIENSVGGDCLHCKLTPVQLDCVVRYLEGGRDPLEEEFGTPCLAWEVPAEEPNACIGYPR